MCKLLSYFEIKVAINLKTPLMTDRFSTCFLSLENTLVAENIKISFQLSIEILSSATKNKNSWLIKLGN
jgi:hypothetical protein